MTERISSPVPRQRSRRAAFAWLLQWAVTVAGLLLLSSCKDGYEKVEIETGYKGVARRDPFLAAQRMLEQMGLEAESKPVLGVLPDWQDTLIINTQGVTEVMADELMEWANEGGHLICLLSHADGYYSWQHSLELYEDSAFADDPILRRLGLEMQPLDEGVEFETAIFNLDDERELVIEISSSVGIVADATWGYYDPVYREANQAFQSRFYSRAEGEGRVSVLVNARPWRNRYIGELDNATFLWEVVDLHGYGKVWFVYGADLSFWGLLWDHAWMALISLVGLVLVWLWHAWPRTGPVYSFKPPSKGVMDHIEMSGRFLWKHGCQEELLQPLRQHVANHFHRLYLTELNPNNPEHIARLAEHTGLSQDTLLTTLTARVGKDVNAMTAIVQQLQTMIQRL